MAHHKCHNKNEPARLLVLSVLLFLWCCCRHYGYCSWSSKRGKRAAWYNVTSLGSPAWSDQEVLFLNDWSRPVAVLHKVDETFLEGTKSLMWSLIKKSHSRKWDYDFFTVVFNMLNMWDAAASCILQRDSICHLQSRPKKKKTERERGGTESWSL